MGNSKNYWLPIAYSLIFVLCTFGQLMCFHFLAFQGIPIKAIQTDPPYFWSIWLPKISISFFMGGLCLLFKKKGWTLVFCVILSLWTLAELVYYRINGFFLDKYSITMVGNMKGFWDSIIPFLYFKDLILAFFPTVLIFAYVLFPHNGKVWPLSLVFLLLSTVIHIGDAFCLKELIKEWEKSEEYSAPIKINPFTQYNAVHFWGFTSTSYVRQLSALHALLYNSTQLLFGYNPNYELTTAELTDIQRFVEKSCERVESPNRLIIILFESLESWAITPISTPNISSFIDKHSNILLARKVKKQTKAGASADGQMIVNTGILPITDGATCFRYPEHIYPSISSLYEKSAIILPGDSNVWNQERMNVAYGIDSSFTVKSGSDSLLIRKTTEVYPVFPFVMTLTIASHTPFSSFSDKRPIQMNPLMPNDMKNYLNCVHYTDDCLSSLLSLVDDDPIMANTTIVITGDHTIFSDENRETFKEYCIKNNEDYSVTENYCPLIIYSPAIKEKTIIDEECYQMDIYPTLLNLIGCGDYYWRGFGRNLLDSNSKRLINEEDAFELSDKIIKADYFSNICPQ